MPSITITVDIAEIRSLMNRAPGQVDAAMRSAAEDSRTYILAIQQRYPPQRAGSTYRRTHILQKSWSGRIEGSGLSIRVVIGSNSAIAPYNRYVQDRDRQARVHRGRWTNTVQGTAQSEQGRVAQFFANRLGMVGR